MTSNNLGLFYPNILFDENERTRWIELLKSKERWERKQNETDHLIQKMITWVEDRSIADAWVLPMDWTYYFEKGIQKKALKFCEEAQRLNMPVLSFTGGDYGVELDLPSVVLLYRMGGYLSRLKYNERIMPFFLSDPIQAVYVINEEELYTDIIEKPIVGFCGMAPKGILSHIREYLVVLVHNVNARFGNIPYQLQQVFSSSRLRNKALTIFKNSVYFKSNFILRQKHRGGAKTSEERLATTIEYYANMFESDLIICARGAGNFSVRFFETLAMGRIPIFLDTDSPLPDIGAKNWDDYLIRINIGELNAAPEKVFNWLSERNILEQKEQNRKLWLEHLSLLGFWRHELDRLIKLNH